MTTDTILVVEDDADQREVLVEYLRGQRIHGPRVAEWRDGPWPG
jgi:CheY-like chemotaxis protein